MKFIRKWQDAAERQRSNVVLKRQTSKRHVYLYLELNPMTNSVKTRLAFKYKKAYFAILKQMFDRKFLLEIVSPVNFCNRNVLWLASLMLMRQFHVYLIIWLSPILQSCFSIAFKLPLKWNWRFRKFPLMFYPLKASDVLDSLQTTSVLVFIKPTKVSWN